MESIMAEKDFQEQINELLSLDEDEVENLENHYAHISHIYFYNLKDYKNALVYCKKMAEKFPSGFSINNLALLLNMNGIKRNVINYYKRAIKLEPQSSQIFSNCVYYITKQKLFDSAIKIKTKRIEYTGYLEILVRFADACIDNKRLDAFILTDNLLISDKCKDYDDYFIVKTIFEETQNLENRSIIRALLLSLCSNIKEIKDNLKYPIHKPVCHYSRIENLKSLLKPKEETKFRINNVLYMNDPSEGSVFGELIKQVANKDYKDIYEKKENYREQINNSNTYLCSFTQNIDNLPMWVQYGNDGKGCCLIFEKDFFDNDNEPLYNLTTHNLSEIDIVEEFDNDTQEIQSKYVLYKVEYVNEIKKCSYKEQFETIAFVLHELQNQNIDNEKFLDHARNILDQIRFLFKSVDYAHEKEIRLVKWSNEPKYDKGEREREIPHLYIEMDKPLKLKEVILGPKVEKPSEIAPYLYFTGKVTTVSKSTIKYQ